ncbi:MAG: histidinol-phosphatase [Rhizobiales bacterium]|nr:histidinol-phosphatase [Hyphomicrobiales bacterium]MBN9010891.1 histidinol-phosphatase [Hyphomicrobiales bacterium]
MDFQALAGFLDRLADAATEAIMPHFRVATAVENKKQEAFDPVTEADRGAEAAMRKLINETWPGHGIIGEEYGAERDDAECIWVLDPIDGTRSFISGIPLWGVLIGLLVEGRPALGMMAQPFTGERFSGDGKQAWYAGARGRIELRSRPCPSLGEAVLFTTTPALFKGGDKSAYERVESSVRMPRYGTDCYGYCMVAAGHADLVVEAGLQPYDVVALIPIVEGAGGRFTGWDGGSAAGGGKVVAAGDPRLHALALEKLAGA